MKRSIAILVSLTALVAMTTPDGVVRMEGSFLHQLQERDSVLIGDQVLYGVTLENVDEGTRFMLPDLSGGIMDSVEVVREWSADTIRTVKGRRGASRRYDIRMAATLTSFEEGDFLLPPINMLRILPDGSSDTLVFDPQLLEVRTFDVDTTSYVPHDIRVQVRYPLTFAEILPYAAAVWILAVIAIAVGCIMIMRRREESGPVAVKEAPHIVALRTLDRYRGNRYWAPEKQKLFYSGVTDALREYISERYGFGAREMTTAEIFAALRGTDVPAGLYEDTKTLFESSDFVKFAKLTLPDEDNAKVLPLAVRFVTETYQSVVDNESASAAEVEKEG